MFYRALVHLITDETNKMLCMILLKVWTFYKGKLIVIHNPGVLVFMSAACCFAWHHYVWFPSYYFASVWCCEVSSSINALLLIMAALISVCNKEQQSSMIQFCGQKVYQKLLAQYGNSVLL
jgi:hypothetical protein